MKYYAIFAAGVVVGCAQSNHDGGPSVLAGQTYIELTGPTAYSTLRSNVLAKTITAYSLRDGRLYNGAEQVSKNAEG
jgi:hypothetical protein